ncbi:MAG: amidohydrolase family protein [Planctomycetes bacterium]|nr:amidohydrolase family protein [Planctomycetota bacterium]
MKKKNLVSRRSTLKGLTMAGAFAFLKPGLASSVEASEDKMGCGDMVGNSEVRKTIFNKVAQTPLVDTHEHLVEEKLRVNPGKGDLDDWTLLLKQYFDSEVSSAGMGQKDYDKFFSADYDPIRKWQILKPYWRFVKNTGYGRAVRITFKRLYDVDDLNDITIAKIQNSYEKTRKKGFYKYILKDICNIHSCQVNSLSSLITESAQPELLMQDLSILDMILSPGSEKLSKPAGIKVKNLSDWHKVIDWWFGRYARYAVAIKSQHAYYRDIDYERVSQQEAEGAFRKTISKQQVTAQEKKLLEDHIFWYAVDKASANNLPVKLHTGYYAGHNYMTLARVVKNPASAAQLCKLGPDKKFVFMHICYPYYEQIITVAKHFSNAYIDMCWAWIINPVAAKDFLKKYIVAAPANKVLTFGGDYLCVEPVIGHAAIARMGISLALSELVEDGFITLSDAMELIDPIMHENAKTIFNIEQKQKVVMKGGWA